MSLITMGVVARMKLEAIKVLTLFGHFQYVTFICLLMIEGPNFIDFTLTDLMSVF